MNLEVLPLPALNGPQRQAQPLGPGAMRLALHQLAQVRHGPRGRTWPPQHLAPSTCGI